MRLARKNTLTPAEIDLAIEIFVEGGFYKMYHFVYQALFSHILTKTYCIDILFDLAEAEQRTKDFMHFNGAVDVGDAKERFLQKRINERLNIRWKDLQEATSRCLSSDDIVLISAAKKRLKAHERHIGSKNG